MGVFHISDGILSLYTGTGKWIKVPDGVTEIGTGVFKDRYGVLSVKLPESVTEIDADAFTDCRSLTGIDLPNGLAAIGDCAFCNCQSIMNVALPNGLASMGDYVFWNCRNLRSITLPDSLTDIGTGVFAYCVTLQSVALPEGLRSIGDSAFEYCVALEELRLPDSVTDVGHNAFAGCTALRKITLPDNEESLGMTELFNRGNTVINAPRVSVAKRSMPVETKLSLARGFAEAVMQGRRILPERKEEYLAYIRKNKSKLLPYAAEDEALLRLMLIERMLTKKNCEELLTRVYEDSRAALMLSEHLTSP